MTRIENIIPNDDFESIAENVEETSGALQQYSLPEQPVFEKTGNFSLNHKNPELQAVITQTEIMNVSHERLTPEAIDASFAQAQNALLDHFATKFSALPDDVKTNLLKSLDLESSYQPNFPLFAQINKSSLFA